MTTRSGAPSASLTFAAKAETMVVDDDLRPLPRGSGIVGRLATRAAFRSGYYKDADRSARTFVEIDGARWSLPGDMATIDADGTVHLLGRGSLVHQHGRREGVSRGSRGRVEDARRDRRRGRGRRARRPLRATGGRGHRTRERERPARPGVGAGALPRASRRLQGAARALHVVDVVERTAAGKPDYASAAPSW